MNDPIDEPIPVHRASISGYTRPEKHGFYNTMRWRKLRLIVLAANPLCVKCRLVANNVDHIDGNNQNNELINLQSLCQSCHSKKSWLERQTDDMKKK